MKSLMQFFKDSFENIKFIKSETNYKLELALVCIVTENNYAFCYKFYISNYIGKYYKKITLLTKCRTEIYGMKITYLHDTEEVIFACANLDGSIQIVIFDQDLSTIDFTYKQFKSCINIYGYSVLYSLII